MRLLHASTGEMKDFISDSEIPPYAILSHTWGEEEVTFRDWHALSVSELESRAGHLKIAYCCQQAIRDGLDWIWVDT